MASKRGNRSMLDRSAAFDAKVDAARIGGIVDIVKARMVNNYASALEPGYTVEIDTKAFLGNAGVSPLQYAAYIGFGKQILRLRTRGYTGDTLQNEVLAKAVTWRRRGLDNLILDGIALLQSVVILTTP